MYSIQTLNKISDAGLDVFTAAGYRFSDTQENPDAIIVRSADMHSLALGDNLRAIARAGAGTNNIPVDKCSEAGIVVFNTPGANANAVKELVLSSLVLASREVTKGIEWTKTLKGKGEQVGPLVEKGKGQFAGSEISGKKLGIIGLGAIGIMVANVADHLGMEVYGHDPYMSVEAAWGLSRSTRHARTIGEIFANCDYISLHLPLTKETKGMINAPAIAAMKDGVRLLNFSRDSLVEDDAVLEAVQSGKISCYVTDFPTDKLIDVPGILTIPHLGASTLESEDNCARMAAKELVDFLETGSIQNSVNFNNVSLSKPCGPRVTIIHRNIPAMLTKIATIFSSENINIEHMANSSKGNFAYTAIDLTCGYRPHMNLYEKLQAIEGIIKTVVIYPHEQD